MEIGDYLPFRIMLFVYLIAGLIWGIEATYKGIKMVSTKKIYFFFPITLFEHFHGAIYGKGKYRDKYEKLCRSPLYFYYLALSALLGGILIIILSAYMVFTLVS